MFEACDKNKIDKRVSRFVIPFCATLNADGSALFITASAMFIASISGHPLAFGKVVTLLWVSLKSNIDGFFHDICPISLLTMHKPPKP